MKIIKTETLINIGNFPKSSFWLSKRKFIHDAIKTMEHPEGARKFILYPEPGKERGKGNGVTPIKINFMEQLLKNGWKIEEPLKIATRKRPGKLDAVYYGAEGNIALEWETGNISSSHRALNKICLGLIKKIISAGILIVPSREMYKYLTDRVGNISELEPYLDLWRSIKCENGILEIIVIEHDGVSFDVPKIPKGTDGRALA